jgi:hypothetical protein
MSSKDVTWCQSSSNFDVDEILRISIAEVKGIAYGLRLPVQNAAPRVPGGVKLGMIRLTLRTKPRTPNLRRMHPNVSHLYKMMLS